MYCATANIDTIIIKILIHLKYGFADSQLNCNKSCHTLLLTSDCDVDDACLWCSFGISNFNIDTRVVIGRPFLGCNVSVYLTIVIVTLIA